MGIGCISEPFARPYLDSGKLFALNMTELPPQRNICLVTDGRTAPSHAAEKLLEGLLAE
jgi:DNA-binding transcriptional LysR family regulator